MRQAIMTAAQPTVTIPVPKKKSSGLKDRKSSSRHAGQGTGAYLHHPGSYNGDKQPS